MSRGASDHTLEERRQCRDCPHVQYDCCSLYGVPLAVRITVPSGARKFLRTRRCRQEFIDPPFSNDKRFTEDTMSRARTRIKRAKRLRWALAITNWWHKDGVFRLNRPLNGALRDAYDRLRWTLPDGYIRI